MNMFVFRKQNIILFFILSILPVFGKDISIVENGKSSYIIVIPDKQNDPLKRVSQAGSLLQQGIYKTTGSRLPLYFESRRPRNKKAIFLGNTKEAKTRKIIPKKLDDWDCLLKVNQGDLFLIGTDKKTDVKNFRPNLISGDGEIKGTLRAVTVFLRDYAKTAFLLPGTDGIAFAKLKKLTIEKKLNRLDKVKMRAYTRLCDSIYDCANNFIAMDKYKSYGGHSYYSAVPVSKYGKTNPEYFILHKGKRTPILGPASWQQNHLCISNLAVQELMLKEMEKQFDLGYDLVQLAQTDGCKECECKNCLALGKNHGERLWQVHRQLAEKMNTRRPGKKVVILSYGPTGNPPESFSKFPQNVIIELSNYSQEDLAAWKKFNIPLLAYVYNWGEYHTLGFLPKRTPAFVERQIRAMATYNTIAIYRCGFGENFGLEGPVYYVFGQMLKNPALSAQMLADEFYKYAYGPSAPHMKRFFDDLYRSLELYSHLPLWPGERHWHNSSIMPRNPEIMIPAIFPPSLLRKMRTNLTAAFRAVPKEDKAVFARLKLVQREFDYMWSVAKIYSLYRASLMSDDSMMIFDLMASEIQKHNAMINSWYDSKGNMKRFYNWPVVFANVPKNKLLAGGNMSGTLKAPFTWDLAGVRRGRIAYRNKKASEMMVKFINSPKELNFLQKKESLTTVNGSKVKNKTNFTVAYDKKNLYFAIQCDWKEAETVLIKSLGANGPAWNQESIDILICPSDAKDKYFHFIFNPIENSFYIGRFGFITNALDPGYGKYEKISIPWNYKASIDKNGKKWYATVQIPFKSLNVKSPVTKDIWTMNLSRLNFVSNKESQLSIWSQIPGEMAFKNLAAFGNLVFE